MRAKLTIKNKHLSPGRLARLLTSSTDQSSLRLAQLLRAALPYASTSSSNGSDSSGAANVLLAALTGAVQTLILAEAERAQAPGTGLGCVVTVDPAAQHLALQNSKEGGGKASRLGVSVRKHPSQDYVVVLALSTDVYQDLQ